MDFAARAGIKEGMPKGSAHKSRQRSENAVLDRATQQLLRATKDEAKKKGKPIDWAQLSKKGYSAQFIEKVDKV
jgi:hypothetical protein